MDPVGYLTSSSDIMQSYAGDYIELVNEELTKTNPDVKVLIDSFLKILDSVTVLLHRETPVIHHENSIECDCGTYISEHLNEIIQLEENLQTTIGQEVMTDPNTCWLSRTLNKYRLLYHMMERGAQFTIHPTVDGMRGACRGRHKSLVEFVKTRERAFVNTLLHK